MQSRNPAFRSSQAFSPSPYASFKDAPPPSADELQRQYAAPAATGVDTGRMTMDDVVVKTGLCFAVLLPAAAVNYYLGSAALFLLGMAGGLVLSIFISLKQVTNPAAILTFAGLEGLFIGGLSAYFERQWPGIVAQAVLATLAVFAVALFVYKSGRIRVTPKLARGVMIGVGAYLVFSVVNLMLASAGVGDGWGLRQGPLGFAIGLFAVGLATLMLMLDFDFAEQGVRNGIPERYSWLAAFGLLSTLVWLYVELLRLIAILRGDD